MRPGSMDSRDREFKVGGKKRQDDREKQDAHKYTKFEEIMEITNCDLLWLLIDLFLHVGLKKRRGTQNKMQDKPKQENNKH